ncbi:MAG TPA: DUF3309 family protein [Bryobacteraceae bacterium]|jgi:hypothetical protein|nr:DUF3309 family protein [Bryobacteraceae bacterium]
MSRALLLIVLLFLALALLPTWPYSTGWGFGYYPSGGLFLLLVILLVILFIRPRAI